MWRKGDTTTTRGMSVWSSNREKILLSSKSNSNCLLKTERNPVGHLIRAWSIAGVDIVSAQTKYGRRPP